MPLQHNFSASTMRTIMHFSILALVQKFCHGRNVALAFETIHKTPMPLCHYC
jgi:hypothetical protein